MRDPSPPRLLAALDLDRTLVYSVRSLERFGGPVAELVPIEHHDDVVVSYAHRRMAALLAELAQRAHVVPTTARTPEQYARLQLPPEVKAGHAICAGGAQIVVDGVVDRAWQAQIEAEIQATGLTAADTAEWLTGAGAAVLKVRTAGGLFSYAVLDLEPDMAAEALDLQVLRDKLDGHGWRLAFSGRKLYALPAVVAKSRAIAYLADRLGTRQLFSAGDSELDAVMLAEADVSVAPAHGDAAARAAATMVTSTTGPAAALEILDEALRLTTQADAPADLARAALPRSQPFNPPALTGIAELSAGSLLRSAATGARSGHLEKEDNDGAD